MLSSWNKVIIILVLEIYSVNAFAIVSICLFAWFRVHFGPKYIFLTSKSPQKSGSCSAGSVKKTTQDRWTINIWAASWQNEQNGMCAQRRLRSAWASTQSDQNLRCPYEESLVLSYPLSAQQRLWSDWADAQADLSLRWAHSHFVGFVMSRLIYSTACFMKLIQTYMLYDASWLLA